MMLRALMLMLVLLPCVALAQEEVAPAPVEPAPVAKVEAAPTEAPVEEPRGCARWKAEGLGEGPVAIGFLEADVATGRRACPRSEVGVGGRFAAIIDTPNFYGNLVGDGLVFGSVALGKKTEIFGTLEFIEYNWVQNASLKGQTLSLGTLTLGATRHIYGADRFLGSLSARLLLPTSGVIPNTRLIGAEVGHALTWRARDWIEVHGYLGVDFTTGLGNGPTLTRFGGVITAGVQISPVSFAALVIDATGRVGAKNYFAPAVALRFRVFRLGIELHGTLPVVGTDRHDFIVGGRFAFRL